MNFSVLNVDVTEVLGRLGNIELGLTGGNDDWQISRVDISFKIALN